MQHCAHSDPLSLPFFILEFKKNVLIKLTELISKFPLSNMTNWKMVCKVNLSTHFAYRKVKINRGILNIVIRMEPFAAEPKLYFKSLHMAVVTGESVGLRKYQNATAPAKANC